MAKKLVFISGPIGGRNAVGEMDMHKIYQNGAVMMRTAHEVWTMGAVALCPYGNTFCFTGAVPYEQLLEGDLLMLKRCDVMVHAYGWQNSPGALVEHKFAEDNNIPICNNLDEFRRWLHGN